jgi:shikimate 5-dehydrogenase
MLDSLSESAEKMGAVNTVIVQNGPFGRKLRGDNTDWLGILKCVNRKSFKPQTGIVIGAGGAARAAVFAMQHLCVPNVVVINRTRTKAEKLATQFPSLNIVILEKLADAPASGLIIGCIPADNVTEQDIPLHIFDDDGLVIDMSYRPPVSALMKVAGRRKNWTVLGGVDVLREQAYAQFELWTGRKAPVSVIEQALEENATSSR